MLCLKEDTTTEDMIDISDAIYEFTEESIVRFKDDIFLLGFYIL